MSLDSVGSDSFPGHHESAGGDGGGGGGGGEGKRTDDIKRRSRNLSEKKRRDQFNMLVNELCSMVNVDAPLDTLAIVAEATKLTEVAPETKLSSSGRNCESNKTPPTSTGSASAVQDAKKMDKSSVLRAAINFLRAHADLAKEHASQQSRKSAKTGDKDSTKKSSSSAAAETEKPTKVDADDNVRDVEKMTNIDKSTDGGQTKVDDKIDSSEDETNKRTAANKTIDWKPPFLSNDEFAHLMLEVSLSIFFFFRDILNIKY